MKQLLGTILATAMLAAPACDSTDVPDPPTPRCQGFLSAFDEAKAAWEANRDSKDLRAAFNRAQDDLFGSGCLHS